MQAIYRQRSDFTCSVFVYTDVVCVCVCEGECMDGCVYNLGVQLLVEFELGECWWVFQDE